MLIGQPEAFKAQASRSLDFHLSNPQNLNTYSYVLNNPLKYIDPTGAIFEGARVAYNNFMGNMGQGAEYLYNTSPTWKTVMDNPWIPAAVGIAPLAGYGAATGLTSLSVKYLGGIGAGCLGGWCQKVSENIPKVANGLQLGQRIEGVGTVIENVAGKITGFNHNGTFHGLDQIISRGVRPDVLLNTVQKSLQSFAQPGSRTLYLSQQAAVVLDKAGQVVTSFTSNQFYPKFVNLINKITSGK